MSKRNCRIPYCNREKTVSTSCPGGAPAQRAFRNMGIEICKVVSVGIVLCCPSIVANADEMGIVGRLSKLETEFTDLKRALAKAVLASTIPCDQLPGGNWKPVESARGVFLLGDSTEYNAGDEGGSPVIKLTKEHLPLHNHSLEIRKSADKFPNDGLAINGGHLPGQLFYSGSGPNTTGHTGTQDITISVMPPYRVVSFCRME